MQALTLMPLRILVPRVLRRSCAAQALAGHLQVGQGGTVLVQNVSKVQIVSAWQDHCAVDGDAAMLEQIKIVVDSVAQTLSISGPPLPFEGVLRVTVPQSIDLVVSGDALDCAITNKVEGDVTIECKSGSVEVDKIRGMNISMQLGRASLRVHKLLEGNVNVTAGRVEGKMLNGDVVSIDSLGDISVQAMYAQQCRLTAHSGDLTLGGLHGSAVLHAVKGNLSVSGIDGSFDALAEEGGISLQINRLAQASSSLARAIRGGIQAKINPEIEAELRCESLGLAGRARATVVSESESFIRAAALQSNPGLVTGRLTGKVASGSDGGAAAPANRSGKIDLAQAAKAKHSSGPVSPSSGNLPALSLTGRGHVRIETLSWFEAIRRKYGFIDPSKGSKPVAAGRSASASSRAKELELMQRSNDGTESSGGDSPRG